MHRPFLITALAAALLVSPAAAQTQPEAPAAVAPAPATAEAFNAASQRIIATIDAVMHVEGASPALAVVMVRRGQAPVIHVRGPLQVGQPAQANADTPFYIASQTKAFTGLMALRLHERGVFSLDQSLADVWPNLTLPEGADPRAVTFRQLLSHQGVIENEPLGFRTAYTDLVPSRDYPRLLAQFSTVREPGFRYTNLGYLIYAAALEARTGRDWRSWLESEILRPAGMTRTGTHTSRVAAAELPHYHQWRGGADWVVHESKADATMQAAGGMVSSPNDMARWLQLQLGEVSGVVSPQVLAESQTLQIAAEIESDVLVCQGYAIGWNICRIGAADLRAHGGGYTAVRSAMAFSPELGVGYAFFSNSDSLTGALSQLTTQVFFETIQNAAWEGPTPDALAAQLRTRLPRLVENRLNAQAERRAEAQWEGWVWRPSASELRRYAGRYRSESYGDFIVTYRDGALQAHLGLMDATLEPAKPDLFGFTDTPLEQAQPFAFERNGRRATALTWEGARFERVR